MSNFYVTYMITDKFEETFLGYILDFIENLHGINVVRIQECYCTHRWRQYVNETREKTVEMLREGKDKEDRKSGPSIVQCTIYIEQCKMYAVHTTDYSVHCTI